MIMKKVPIISLLVSNSIPLIGVLFFNWDLFSIFFLYWLETAVIGIYAIPKAYKASKPYPYQGYNRKTEYPLDKVVAHLSKSKSVFRFLITPIDEMFGILPLYLLQLGFYLFVLLLAVLFFFKPHVELTALYGIAYISLLISHGISYKYTYLDMRMYEQTSKHEQLAEPYRRVWVLYIVLIVFGIKLLERFTDPTLLLVIMIIVKSYADIDGYNKQIIKNVNFKI